MKMRCKLLILMVLVAFAAAGAFGSATNVFIAQAAAGAADGSSCANASAVGFFNSSTNWGSGSTQIGPGTTVHLCGVISATLSAQGSGVSGSPIIIFFENGAKLSQPACPTGGCLVLTGKPFIVVDGGTNGIIESTNNGSQLATQIQSVGIYADGATNLIVKNVTCQNLYVHTLASDSAGGAPGAVCVRFITTDNISIHNNVMHDCAWCIFGSGNNESVYSNEIYHCDHAWGFGTATNGVVYTNLTFHDNHVHDTFVWDTASNAFHHDGLHIFMYGTGSVINATTYITGVNIYNNLFDGNWGINNTANVFFEGTEKNINIYNNVSIGFGSVNLNDGAFAVGGENFAFYNNTIIGSGTVTQMNACVGLGGTGFVRNNVVAGCNQLVVSAAKSGNTTSSITWSNNIYADAGGNAFIYCPPAGGSCSFFSPLQFSAWEKATGETNASYHAASGLSSLGFPGSVSAPQVHAGANLTSLGIQALNTDKAGVSRPGTGQGNWDAGAYQFTDFTVTPSTTSILAPTNMSQPFSVAVAPLDGYNTALTISCTVAGATCAANPSTLGPPYGNFNLSMISGAVGDYPASVTVTGTNQISHGSTVTLHAWTMTPPSAPAVSFSSPSTSATSTSTNFAVVAPPQAGGLTATLSCVTPPAGTTCNFKPSSSITLNGGTPTNASVDVTTPAGTGVGDTGLTIQATVPSSAPVLQNATLSVVDFSLPNSLPSLTAVPGNPTTPVSFQIGSLGSFAQPVSLSCTSTGGSNGACNFAPNVAMPGPGSAATQNLYVSVPSATTAGSYTVTMKGLATLPAPANPSTLSHTSSGTLTVNPSSGTAGVTVALANSPTIPMPGELTTLQATVTNAGPATPVSGTLIISFAEPVMFGRSGMTPECTAGFSEVTCTFGGLASGANNSDDFNIPLMAPFERALMVLPAVALSADTNSASAPLQTAVQIRLRPFARNGLTPLEP